MIEKIGVAGSAEECIKKVEATEKAASSRVILFRIPIDGDYDHDVYALVDTFAR